MSGRLYGIGVGPGDPELMTLKAVRLLREADIVAYPTARTGGGVALGVAESYLAPHQERLALVYPATGAAAGAMADYLARMTTFYDDTAALLASHLEAGRTVAILCEGDPFFYGSFMYWHCRLAPRFDTVVVPGISSVHAAPVAAGRPLCHRDDVVTVIPGTLPEPEITARLRAADAAAVMKLGRTFAKVRRALEAAGVLARALYVERATMPGQRVLPAAEVDPATVPYFSLILVPPALWGDP